MKLNYQIQIQRVDNGFVIQGNSDEGQLIRQVALNQTDCQKIVHELVDHIFDPLTEGKISPVEATGG